MTVIRINDVGQGVNRDALPEELPVGVWSNVQNMRARDGFSERFHGIQAKFTQPSIVPYYMAIHGVGSTRYGVHAGLTKVFSDDGTTQTEIGTGFTGAIDDRWSGDSFNGAIVLNNGIDTPKYSTGASTLTTLVNWPSGWLVDSMRAAGNFLVGFAVTRGGVKERHTVVWSDAAEPGATPQAWTASDTNLAGDQSLVSAGALVDGVYWNNMMLVFKEDAVWAMRYVGGNDVFRFDPVAGSGMLFRGCGVATPKGVVVLTSGDVVLHNGLQEISIADGIVRRWIFQEMNTVNWKRSFVTLNPYHKEVWVCFPSVGKAACDTAAVWNWESGKWSIRALPDVTYAASGLVPPSASTQTWSTQTQPWSTQNETWVDGNYGENQSRLVVCTSSQKIGLVDEGETDFGVSFSTRLERTGMHFDDPDTYKLLKEVALIIDASPGTRLNVQFGSQALPDSSVTWGSPKTFTQGTTRFVYDFANGPYLALRITSGGDSPWRLRSLLADIVKKGKH